MPRSWLPRWRVWAGLTLREKKKRNWMLTGRHFLEWGWRHLKSLGHPWDWLQISAACLSSTSFPAQSPFLLALPDWLVYISGKWLLQKRGFFKDFREGRLGQPRTQEIFARWIKKFSSRAWDNGFQSLRCQPQHCSWWARVCYWSWCFRAPCCIRTDKSICTALPEWSTSVSAASAQLCKWTMCYNVSI